LPLASTPQPKLTSAPRSEEKLWYEERRGLEKPSDRKAGKVWDASSQAGPLKPGSHLGVEDRGGEKMTER